MSPSLDQAESLPQPPSSSAAAKNGHKRSRIDEAYLGRAHADQGHQPVVAATEARGWFVYWYDVKSVFADAALGLDGIDAFSSEVARSVGPPWRTDHKTAMAAAIAATRW